MAEAQQVRPLRLQLPSVPHRLFHTQMGEMWFQAQAVEDEDGCWRRLQVHQYVIRDLGAVGYVGHGVLNAEAETHEVLLLLCRCRRASCRGSARTARCARTLGRERRDGRDLVWDVRDMLYRPRAAHTVRNYTKPGGPRVLAAVPRTRAWNYASHTRERFDSDPRVPNLERLPISNIRMPPELRYLRHLR